MNAKFIDYCVRQRGCNSANGNLCQEIAGPFLLCSIGLPRVFKVVATHDFWLSRQTQGKAIISFGHPGLDNSSAKVEYVRKSSIGHLQTQVQSMVT